MTLPTGGQIIYSYTNFADSECFPTVHVTRAINTRATPDGGTWTYVPTVIIQCTSSNPTKGRQQMAVTKPSGDKSTYIFDVNPLPTNVKGGNGGVFPIEVDYNSASGTLLAKETQSFDYSQTVSTFVYDGYVEGGWGGYATKLSATTTLPIPGGSSVNQTTQFCYDINYGNLLHKWEWNFYTGAVIHDPNPPTNCSVYSGYTPDRTTTYSYLNNSNYINSTTNITNRPTSVVTSNSGGTVSQTNYCYDYAGGCGGSSFTSQTGASNHDDTHYGSGNMFRGDLTQVSRWLNTTGGWLSTNYAYDMLGNRIQITDPNLNQTSISYTDNFYNYTPSKPTYAYPTTTTNPPTNGVNHIEKTQYYFGTGLPSARCGQNFSSACTYGLALPQPDYTSYSYDTMNRVSTQIFGDGGQTTFSYPSPTQIQQTQKISSSVS